MKLQFNRDYFLKITLKDEVVEIKPPLRVVFNCTKSLGRSANKIRLSVYNLAENTRLKLLRDPTSQDDYNLPINTKLEFSAGYSGELNTLFMGSIYNASSSRQGVDFVTEIECIDGIVDIQNAFTARTVAAGADVVGSILGDMPNTKAGEITSQSQSVRPRVLVGNSYKLIQENLKDNQYFFIDYEKLNVINGDEFLSGQAVVVSPETGLKQTPTRKNNIISFDTVMSLVIKLGGTIDLQSDTAKNINGVYRVETIVFSGDNYGSDWMQSVECRNAGAMKVLT